METKMTEKKIKVLEHAFAASVGAYYNINLTKDLVPGEMYQVIREKEYSLNEQMGLPQNAKFSDVVAYWGERLEEKEKEAYFRFFSIPNLLEAFQKGSITSFISIGRSQQCSSLCWQSSTLPCMKMRKLAIFWRLPM